MLTILHLLHRFKRNSGFSYDEMLFFDDEYRNIVDLTRIGKYLTKSGPPYELQNIADKKTPSAIYKFS